jgi:hypothetical protein
VRHLTGLNDIRAALECRASGALDDESVLYPGLPPLGSRLATGPPGLALLFIDPILNSHRL